MATQITSSQLNNLINSSSLTTGETYVVTDYPNYQLSMKAESESTLSDESYNYTTRDDLVFHYVPATNTVDYMKNTFLLIEGNFDWTSNVSGKCYDIHLENSTGLTVTNCTGIYCEGSSTGTITNGQYIRVSDGCDVTISSAQYLTICQDNTVTITGCRSIDIGSGNDLSLNKLECCSIGDNNSGLTLQGKNVIGSDNRDITVYGDSNVIKSGNIMVEVYGECNSIDRTKYFNALGSYNETDKTTLSTLDIAYGNKVKGSDSVDIKDTNNNVLKTDNIEVVNKPAFVEYATVGSVRRVTDLVGRINLQADNTATTLIIDQQRMWQSPETKDTKHFIIVDGEWQDIANQ